MGALHFGRTPKDVTVTPIGPHVIEHGAHRAVLAGAIHALQHDQQRPLAFGIEPVLQVVDRLGIS